ncbi:hypothetical protein DER46DRAFT_639027 [Fusarium sp. MPI-SDFR-AT-0072]|nr:hypothetical protein DER46DRAFT_639027 [Fusarium sp. MPI-SDFR-AT-0072]
MQFFTKTLLAASFLGSFASSAPFPTPSLTTSIISGTSIAPLATDHAAHNATQHVSHLGAHHASHKDGHHENDDFVGHSESNIVLAVQHGLAMDLVPVSDVCTSSDYCYKDIHGKKFLTGDINKALKNFTVSMEQVKTSPLTIEVKITNNSTGPITFWKDLSPISSYALDLGYFNIQTEIDGVVFGERTRAEAHGYRPDWYSDLVEIGPGTWMSARITLPEKPDTPKAKTWRKMLEMGGDTTVRMYGNWYGIWAATKEQVMATDMEFSQYGFNFWNDLYIPWEATFPEESGKYFPGMGYGMSLELE